MGKLVFVREMVVMVGWSQALGRSFPPLKPPLPPPPSRSSSATSRTGKAAFLRTRCSATPSGGGAGSSNLPRAAVEAAAFRQRESNRPDPLFIDPYAGCFLSSTGAMVSEEGPPSTSHYSLATRFIDDKVVGMMNGGDELIKQVVLLTDGTDTRPYRLQWPRSSLIFDVSPGMVFKKASKRLEGVGARIAKACLLLHVPLETCDLQGVLCRKGFNGTRPSIWVLQGLPLTSLADFREILSVVGSLAMRGCIFVGELPCQLMEAEATDKTTVQRCVDKIFMSSGFRVDVMDYAAIAKDLCCDPPSGLYSNVLFVADQLQLSDGQMETWRMEFQRIEEEGDEEGFVDMLF